MEGGLRRGLVAPGEPQLEPALIIRLVVNARLDCGDAGSAAVEGRMVPGAAKQTTRLRIPSEMNGILMAALYHLLWRVTRLW